MCVCVSNPSLYDVHITFLSYLITDNHPLITLPRSFRLPTNLPAASVGVERVYHSPYLKLTLCLISSLSKALHIPSNVPLFTQQAPPLPPGSNASSPVSPSQHPRGRSQGRAPGGDNENVNNNINISSQSSLFSSPLASSHSSSLTYNKKYNNNYGGSRGTPSPPSLSPSACVCATRLECGFLKSSVYLLGSILARFFQEFV